jgi:5,10-methenyltetrahydromethanopterin hydrogenase cofactor biosynthesis protein HmdB
MIFQINKNTSCLIQSFHFSSIIIFHKKKIQGAKLINKIIKKALNEENLEKNEVLDLFKSSSLEDGIKLFEAASEIRNSNKKMIKLTSTVHLTNVCKITPKCMYCGFAAKTSSEGYYNSFSKTEDEIISAIRSIEESGIPRVSCSGAHGFDGKHAVQAAKLVKENTNLELLINVGSDLNMDALQKLAEYQTDTVCCNLETINKNLFNQLKPGEMLKNRLMVCKMVNDLNIELSSGLLIGIGESYLDRVNHLFFLKEFSTLGEVPIMGFNPYLDTPMEDHPPCSLIEQMKTIAIARLLFPHLRITVPAPTIGPENVKFSLMAGADNVATVIPDNYPLNVKGVGSPRYGNMNEVVNTIEELGLIPQIKETICPVKEVGITEI